ncbi:MAG TPA: galactose oxidase-like domain-containing protein [Polyangiaceae bacterium]
MALTFNEVPDWDSWENQGGNVAVATLQGSPALFVLRVDRTQPGPNRAFYRVGFGLNAVGGIDGNWGPWIEIPGWASNDNQGAGIAVADFGAQGLGLVLFQVQHFVPGPNRGLFRVGKGLDAQGSVTGGWSDWQAVPDWTSWRSQGAAITVADLDGDGQPELILFHIDDFHTDNPRQPNKGFYRVGNKLTANGQVSGWSAWFELDWFSWFNQGAGIAVRDLDGDGRPELVIFQIDAPPGENAGFYRVGWKLDAQGRVQAGFGPWVRIERWGSFENQAGGFALVSFAPGRPHALVFDIDNPVGLNAGRFAVIDLNIDTDLGATLGVWRLLSYFSEVLPVHAGLLHTGKVLFFAGSGNNVFRASAGDFGNVADNLYTSVVWDPSKSVFDNATFDHPATLLRGNGSVIDLFCCGHTLLADGRLLAAGGTEDYDKVIVGNEMQNAPRGFTGTREALVFDPVSESWTAIASMAHGRWYPTLVMLSDGSVLAASGLDENSNADLGNTLERNQTPGVTGWQKTRDFGLPLYPHLFQLKDGRLFFTGGKMDTDGDSVPFVFDPRNATAAPQVDGLTDVGRCNQCASVMLPPAQEQRIMILGGGPEVDDGAPRGVATRRTAVADFSVPNPAYETTAALHHERMHVNAVLLPDRTVLAVGGGVTREASLAAVVDPQGGREVFEGEIYDPVANEWTITAPATVARLYHSVALLLPDGRVLTAGGNPDKGRQVPWLPPDPFEEMRIELYSPPYLFKNKPRPQIVSVPQELTYGTQVAIKFSVDGSLHWVSLIKAGLTTHSFNGTQRLVDVPFVLGASGTLTANILVERTVAPPGWYMLFLTDMDGVPSVASWVHLS